jgi:outer membrane protein assembly factor BamD (BamD/ComL family)
MIETARSALVRGDASGALAVLSRHASAFPRGQLSETREALAIQALARLGRGAEARSRAERFRRDYPSSVYQSVVDEATGTISP